MAEFCCIWIPYFRLMAKPLYEALKGNDSEPLSWTVEYHNAFCTIQIIEEVYSSRPTLTDQPLENTNMEMFMDGCSFIGQ